MRSILAVFLKEMTDGLRDKRSVFITWVLPLFLFPAVVFLLSMHTGTRQFTVGTDSLEPGLIAHLRNDDHILLSDLHAESDILNYAIDASIKGYEKDYFTAIEISFNSSVRKSLECLEYLKAKITEYKVNRVMEGDVTGESIVISLPVDDITSGSSKLILFTILPVMLMVISVTSPIAIASEIIAGEKEKNSLELLLISTSSRFYIIIGKWMAVFMFGFIGVLCFIAGVVLSFYINSDVYGFSKLSLSAGQVIMIFIIVFCITTIFSSLETLLSLFARTAKESQLYIIPLSIISIGAATFSESLYFSITSGGPLLYWVPFFNCIHFLREVIMLDFSLYNIIPVIITSFMISAVFLITAGVLSRSEKIIYRS